MNEYKRNYKLSGAVEYPNIVEHQSPTNTLKKMRRDALIVYRSAKESLSYYAFDANSPTPQHPAIFAFGNFSSRLFLFIFLLRVFT